MSKSPLYVPCPNCKTDVLWDEKSPFRPFCSKRCQLIDLGEWADENHRISGTELSVEGLSVEELESIIDLDNHPYQD